MIKIDKLTKHYDDVVALDNFSVEIPHGTVGILGPNGAGKTTLIKVLLGLVKPTSGAASLFEHDIIKQGFEVRKKIGYMPEQDCYLSDLNAVQYVAHFAQLMGLTRKDALQRAHEALDYVGSHGGYYDLGGVYSTGSEPYNAAYYTINSLVLCPRNYLNKLFCHLGGCSTSGTH